MIFDDSESTILGEQDMAIARTILRNKKKKNFPEIRPIKIYQQRPKKKIEIINNGPKMLKFNTHYESKSCRAPKFT